MHKITKYVRGLIVACMAALGLNAWAVEVGEEVTWSNLETEITDLSNAGKAQFKLCYQPQSGLPAGSTVTLTKIVIANRSDDAMISQCLKLTVGSTDYYTGAVSTDVNPSPVNAPTTGTPATRKLSTYVFEGESQPTIVVGQVYDLTAVASDEGHATDSQTSGASAIQNGPVAQNAAIWWNHTVSTSSNWQILCELTVTVAELPNMYTYTIGTGWDTEPQSLTADDVVIYTGEGVATLEKSVPGTLIIENGADVSVTASQIEGTVTISAGATMTLTEGSLDRSKLTNNGTIKIQGGTREAPITINDNGGIGAVKITAGSVFKNAATGGNKVYNVTGEGPTSVFIMGSGQNWGMNTGTTIRNCTVVIVEKEFWIENKSFMDSTVNIETDKTLHIGHGQNTNQAFEFGSIKTTADIGNNDNGYTVAINLSEGNASSFGGSFSRPLTVKGTGTLALNASCTGAITIDEDAVVTLTTLAGNNATYVVNGTLKTTTRIPSEKLSTTFLAKEVVESESEGTFIYTVSSLPIAKIGDKTYASLAQAIEAVTDGEVIELLESDDAAFELTKNVTVSVAEGKTITLSGVISGSSSLTKKGQGELVLAGGNTFTGGLNVDEGKVKNGHTGSIPSGLGQYTGGNNVDQLSVITVAEGAVLDVAGIAGNGYGSCYRVNLAGEMTNSGADFRTDWRQMSQINVTGTKAKVTGNSSALLCSGYAATKLVFEEGSALEVDLNANKTFWLRTTAISGTGTLAVKSGTVEVLTGTTLASGSSVNVVLSAGAVIKTNGVIPAASITAAEGCTVQIDGNTYTGIEGKPVVAKIGDVGYETLADAIEAVTAENKTITLCAPASDEIAIATGKDVIIDLNGNNITSPMSIKGNLKIVGQAGQVQSKNIKVYGEEGDSSGHFDVSEATIVAPANTFTVFLLLKSAKVTDMPTATFKGDDRRIFVTGGTEGGYLATSDFTTDFSTEDGKKIFTAVIPATLDSGEGRIYVMSEAGEAWVTPTGSTTTITIHNLPSTIEKVYLPVDSSVITVTGQNEASVIPYFYDTASKLTYDLSDVCVGLQEDGSYKVELDATKVTPVLTATVEDETTVAPFVVDESAVSLGVTSKPGLLYTLKRAASLTADYVAVQEVRATTETIRLTDTNKPEGQAFYKVAVGTKTTAAQ